MATTAGVSYTYDGNGLRVKKSDGKLYWYSYGGALLAESDASGTIISEYIFFGGMRIARRDVLTAEMGHRIYFTSAIELARRIDLDEFGWKTSLLSPIGHGFEILRNRILNTPTDPFTVGNILRNRGVNLGHNCQL